MTAHTPGPWSIKYRTPFGGGEPYFDGVIDADGRQLRVDGVTLTSGPIAEANARLMAAAPNMLEALHRAALALAFAAETSPAMRDDCEAILTAIANATGSAT